MKLLIIVMGQYVSRRYPITASEQSEGPARVVRWSGPAFQRLAGFRDNNRPAGKPRVDHLECRIVGHSDR